MNILKKSMVGLCATLLVLVLFVFGLSFSLYQVFATPDALKGALRDSGIYESAISDALKQMQKEQPAEGEEGIPIDNPDVQNIIESVASPDLLQTQAEGILDASYAWLQGKTPNLTFTIELGDAKGKLADELARYLEQRLSALPACAPGSSVPSQDVDPFAATCLPQGANTAELANRVKGEINSGDFLKETTFTAADLKTDDGKTIEQQLQAIPQVYRAVKWTLVATGILALLLALGVTFLSVTWRSGLKKLSIIAVVVGSTEVLFSLLAGMGLARAADLAKEPLQQSGVKVVQALGNDLRSWWMWYGIILLAVGVVTLVVLLVTKPKTATETKMSEGLKEDPVTMPPYLADKPKAVAAAEHKQKPKPVKRLVQ